MNTNKSKNSVPEERLELCDNLLATNPDIKRKGGTMPYTSINGHMFSFLNQQGTMGLRFSKENIEAFIQKFKTRLIEPYGRIIKD